MHRLLFKAGFFQHGPETPPLYYENGTSFHWENPFFQHEFFAKDGTPLYARTNPAFDSCIMLNYDGIRDKDDIVLDTFDNPALIQGAVDKFFSEHGGIGKPVRSWPKELQD